MTSINNDDNNADKNNYSHNVDTSSNNQVKNDSNIEGPTMLWGMLKGKDVLTNDGEELGKIKEISQNCFLTEKGTLKKHRLWIPKYLTDAFDGKTLWLLVSEDEIVKNYNYQDNEPSNERYLKDLESFKNSPTARDFTQDADIENKIRVVENYKNIRNLK